MVRDRSAAEDVAQDTFLKAFTRLETYEPQYKLSNWLLKIAHNTAIDYLRLRRVPTVSLDGPVAGDGLPARALVDGASTDPVRNLERAEIAGILERALSRLRAYHQQVIVLRYHEDLSHEEIAGIMGIPVGTVKSHLHRARAELAEHVRNMLPAGAWNG